MSKIEEYTIDTVFFLYIIVIIITFIAWAIGICTIDTVAVLLFILHTSITVGFLCILVKCILKEVKK